MCVCVCDDAVNDESAETVIYINCQLFPHFLFTTTTWHTGYPTILPASEAAEESLNKGQMTHTGTHKSANILG